nr:MAG TPA: hypothetical protein [Caudoviricetes sp.]
MKFPNVNVFTFFETISYSYSNTSVIISAIGCKTCIVSPISKF